MTLTISRRMPVVIAAAPAAVQSALDELDRTGIELNERPGGVKQLRVFAVAKQSSAHAAAVIERLHLSPRLVEVLELTAEGLSRKEISARLRLSDTTVKSHLARLYRRLDVNGRETAVAAGFRLGILGGGA